MSAVPSKPDKQLNRMRSGKGNIQMAGRKIKKLCKFKMHRKDYGKMRNNQKIEKIL